MPPPVGVESTSTDIVVNPIDGTAMTVADAESDTLAKLVLILREREKRFKGWRQLAEAELISRFVTKERKRVLVGEYELQIRSGHTRVWDGDELNQVLLELADCGVIRRGEWTGLITQPALKVDGNQALELLRSLDGPALAAVERCFRWRDGRPSLEVTESVQLLPEEASDGIR